MPPKRKLLVSTNFVKNDYRKNAKSKRRKTRHDSINLGERYSNGLLKVSKWKSKYEWIAEKKAQLNDNLYLELLDPEELKAVTLAVSIYVFYILKTISLAHTYIIQLQFYSS